MHTKSSIFDEICWGYFRVK